MAENGRRKKGDAALLLAMAAGQTVRDAARSAGIGERTATRRVADPDFRRQVGELRSEMVARALGKMADGMAEAAETLRALLALDTRPTVRLGAARALLELGVRLRESVELAAEVQALKELLATKGISDKEPKRGRPRIT
jgi:hypothetical protein